MNSSLVTQRIALVGAGALLGAASACWYLKRPSSAPSPSAVTVSTPTCPTSAPVSLPLTLNYPNGSFILSPRHSEILKYGLPNTTQLQFKSNYVSQVDYRLREPVWVMEHLTKDNVKGSADRASIGFTQDHDIPKLFRAGNDDYLKSGYSRGHMAPAGDNKISETAMRDSFLLNSNIVPQDLDNNMFYWNRMERWVKHLSTQKGFDSVRVLSGPLFLPSTSAPNAIAETGTVRDQPGLVPSGSISSTHSMGTLPNSAILVPPPSDVYSPSDDHEPTNSMVPGKPFNYVAYKTIGNAQIAVPTHLFKAILAEKHQGPDKPPALFFSAFIVPNIHIPDHIPLRQFQVPKHTLEKYAGLQIWDRAFEMIPVIDLCAVNDPNPPAGSKEGTTICQLESAADFRFFTIDRELAQARSHADLNRVWSKAQSAAAKFNVPIPNNIMAAYDQKSKSLP